MHACVHYIWACAHTSAVLVQSSDVLALAVVVHLCTWMLIVAVEKPHIVDVYDEVRSPST